MKRIACPYCGRANTMLRGISCRVTDVKREYDETYLVVICKIEVYCGQCGEKHTQVVKQYFTRDYDKIPTEHLIDIVLYSQSINFGA